MGGVGVLSEFGHSVFEIRTRPALLRARPPTEAAPFSATQSRLHLLAISSKHFQKTHPSDIDGLASGKMSAG